MAAIRTVVTRRSPIDAFYRAELSAGRRSSRLPSRSAADEHPPPREAGAQPLPLAPLVRQTGRQDDAVFEPIRKRRREMSGKQVGDPKKAAAAMLTLIEAENPPMHLLLGSDALKLVREKLDFLKSEFDAWEKLTLSTDVDSGATS